MLYGIFAVDKFGNIGIKNNKTNEYNLLYNIPGDLKFFKETTKNSIVIVGNTTFKTFKKPLADRLNVVVTSHPIKSEYDNVIYASTIDEVFNIINENKKTYDSVYIIGGASIYKMFNDYVDEYIITYVDSEDLDGVEINTDEYSFVKIDTSILNSFNCYKTEIVNHDAVINNNYSKLINGYIKNAFDEFDMSGYTFDTYHKYYI